MTYGDWRKPCATCEGRGGFFGEFFEDAPFRGGTPWTDCEDCNGSGGSPITATDLEALGERLIQYRAGELVEGIFIPISDRDTP